MHEVHQQIIQAQPGQPLLALTMEIFPYYSILFLIALVATFYGVYKRRALERAESNTTKLLSAHLSTHSLHAPSLPESAKSCLRLSQDLRIW